MQPSENNESLQQQIESKTGSLREAIGQDLTWQYDDKHQAMLAQFAQNRAQGVMATLAPQFTHQWCYSTRKQIPVELKAQLGDVTQLDKNQELLAVNIVDEGCIVALWWPWGHGGTYSLRLALLPEKFNEQQPVQPEGWWHRLKSLFNA